MTSKEKIHALYHGESKAGMRFRFSLLSFDILTILVFIVSSMIETNTTILVIDYIFALIFSLDYLARLYIAPGRLRFISRFESLTDIIVILSLLASAFVENIAFLRVIRMLRLMRSYHVAKELRQSFFFFRKNEQIIQSTINLFVFIFVITAIVYVLEVDRNESINNYMDALYFTVTTLTTTGFGDITLSDTLGRAVAVIIMVFGVGLFLRLVQTIFRPSKVAHSCPTCGLARHDEDAVHCKHCGTSLNIPTDGAW
ncbi:ion transporter [Kordiimonas sediminis]|uniref:Ion transporter n=1 Tax=Kordiimonas sediminis TaxID=1735581 RepID=A0A919AQK5_9PROT|nr:ion channel [Kordiimonas sediminis]GHF20760.1 ion transporter [Kordiimonas sediminis]